MSEPLVPSKEADPDLPDPEESSSNFKRWLAVLVASLTLAGSVVAFLAAQASAESNSAARDAQRASITAMGRRTAADTEYYAGYGIYASAQEYEQQEVTARARELLAPDSGFAEQAEGWSAVRDTQLGFSPLLSEDRYSQEADPLHPFGLQVDLDEGPDQQVLEQQALLETSDAWSKKSGTYGTVITFLAVALSLLGLSLALSGGVRVLLVTPALILALGCVIATVREVVRPVPETDPAAISLLAEGRRLTQQRDFDAALDAAYTQAIEVRPDYATAFSRRADAYFGRGSPDVDALFTSRVDPESLELALADRERAYQLGGAQTDPALLVNLSFEYFLAERYDDARQAALDGLALNDSSAPQWGNLGLTYLVSGEPDEVDRIYDRAIAEIQKRPNPFERTSFYAALRTDLEILRLQQPELEDEIARMTARVVDHETREALGTDLDSDRAADVDLDPELVFNGASIELRFMADAVEEGTNLAYIPYERSNEDEAWGQLAFGTQFETLGQDPEATIDFDDQRVLFVSPSACPRPAQYRIDIYAEGVWVGSAEGEREGISEPYVQEADPVAGFTLCRPEDWEVEETPGAVSTFSPDGEFALSVFVLAVPPDFLEDDPQVLLDAAIELLAEEEGVSDPDEPFDYAIGGQDGTYRYFFEDGAQVGIWASLGEDQVLRTVVSRSPPDQTQVLDDLELDLLFDTRPT